MPTLNDIRSTFLGYFERNGHTVVESGPLVPRNDPTLLFTNSGMVQFKNLFTGLETRSYRRAVTAQKCVRAGGKHNDLDNVGYTARHHTFFEMLGNFSFGDYFKAEAIPFAWELVTGEFDIDPERLLATAYNTDDEAYGTWKKVGLPDSRIIRIGTSDNFWQMGPTGPCGPCTEIFFDHGEKVPGGPPGSPDEDGDRFIEIWNLVFMQNERLEDGTMIDLEMQSIDTGMGLERMGALLQGKHDNYDTDLMRSLILASAEVTGREPDGPGNVHHRVMADHLRSTSFLIADGVLPSNDGRGYVLRRIMRRAMRHAHLLGVREPVMHRMVATLVRKMGTAYPELVRAQALIEETIRLEETRFRRMLERGLKLLDDAVSKLPEGGPLPGETAFRLYDTYGFPLDLTQDALREIGRKVDSGGFHTAMAEQKAKARNAWKGLGMDRGAEIWHNVANEAGPTEFLGYSVEAAEGLVVALARDGGPIDTACAGDRIQVALNQTPFYAESGGQVGDSGEIHTTDGHIRIDDTRLSAGIHVHIGEVVAGRISCGDATRLKVDHARRRAIRANHSATHLLHEALRRTLGDHVAQRGSLNAPDRLRFDFSHSRAVSLEELARVETEVNAYIRQNAPIETRIMTPGDARAIGAQALFGEKYGDEVRVVSIGADPGSGKGGDGAAYSVEICGGTHVRRTGDIGVFVTMAESASSAGVRRVEALTGAAAFGYLSAQDHRLADTALALGVPRDEVPGRVRKLLDERRTLQGEVAQLRRELAMAGDKAGQEVREVNGIRFVAQVLEGVSGKDLPALVDEHKARLGSGTVLLIADTGGKAFVAAGVTHDLTDRVSAIDLVRVAVLELGGKGGGGRVDMARGGGPSASNASAAILAVERVLGG